MCSSVYTPRWVCGLWLVSCLREARWIDCCCSSEWRILSPQQALDKSVCLSMCISSDYTRPHKNATHLYKHTRTSFHMSAYHVPYIWNHIHTYKCLYIYIYIFLLLLLLRRAAESGVGQKLLFLGWDPAVIYPLVSLCIYLCIFLLLMSPCGATTQRDRESLYSCRVSGCVVPLLVYIHFILFLKEKWHVYLPTFLCVHASFCWFVLSYV